MGPNSADPGALAERVEPSLPVSARKGRRADGRTDDLTSTSEDRPQMAPKRVLVGEAGRRRSCVHGLPNNKRKKCESAGFLGKFRRLILFVRLVVKRNNDPDRAKEVE